jgi:hypothetical protein
MISPFLAESSAWSDFWISLIATIGGVVVLVGLLKEGWRPKEWYSSIEEKRAHEAREHCGVKWVIVGVALECALGFGVATKEGCESRALKRQIDAANPINLPVTEMRGRMLIHLKGPSDGSPQSGHLWDSWIELNESNMDTTKPRTLHLGSFNTLYAKDVQAFTTTSDGPVAHGYSFSFEVDSYVPSFTEGYTIPDQRPVTPEILTNRITNLGCKMSFIPPESEITGGEAQITVNGTFKKRFRIPAQKSTKDSYFYATNVVN